MGTHQRGVNSSVQWQTFQWATFCFTYCWLKAETMSIANISAMLLTQSKLCAQSNEYFLTWPERGKNGAGRLAWSTLTNWWKAGQRSQLWDMDSSVLSQFTWHVSCKEMTGLCGETFYINLSHVTQILNVTKRWNILWQELLLCQGSQLRHSTFSPNAMHDVFYEFDMAFSSVGMAIKWRFRGSVCEVPDLFAL